MGVEKQEYAVIIQNMTKQYGKKRGVSSLSLAVEKGDIYGFLGPNGAGKPRQSAVCSVCSVFRREASAFLKGMW